MIAEFLKSTFTLLAVIGIFVGLCVLIIRSVRHIENNVYGVKETIRKIVFAVIALHIYLLYIGVPLWHLAFSLTIQYAFYQFFDSYPVIKPEDPKFLYAVIASLVNHFLMIRVFIVHEIGVINIVLCFLHIWTTPFCFFFTMSASDNLMFLSKDAKKSNRPTKTFAGQALDWLLNIRNKVTAPQH